MVSKRFVVLTVLFLVVVPSVECWSQGTSGAQFLGIGMGARSVGMGGAYVSLATDGSALYWNPAGLSQTTRMRLSVSHVSWLDDASYEYASFATPLGSNGSVGLALEQGSLSWDNTGSGTFEAGDFSGVVGYARRLRPNLGVGGSVKYLRSSLGDAGASSYALDIGAVYALSKSATIGAAVRNLGPGLTFEVESDPLPATITVGGSYLWNDAVFALDFEKVNDSEVTTRAGVEYSPVRYLALRGGMILGGDTALSSFTGGVGLNWDERWAIDYAYRPTDLGGTHWLALTAGLGSELSAGGAEETTYRGTAEELTIPTSNINVLSDLTRSVIATALDKMGIPVGAEVSIRQIDSHAANWLVQSIFLEELTGCGHTVRTAATPPAGGGMVAHVDEMESYEVAYRIVSCETAYTRVWREWLVGARKAERRSSVDVYFQLAGASKTVVWAGSEERERRDIVPGSRLEGLRTPGQAFASPEIEPGGWDKVIEPVVVAGIVGGLIYLFYSSKSSD
jgi:hypothetical protein